MRDIAIIVALRCIARMILGIAAWLLPLALVVFLMWAWAAGLWSLAEHQAEARWLSEIRVIGTASEVILGRAALMQNEGPQSADERHVRLFKYQGDWWVGNASGKRALLLLFEDGAEMRTDRLVAGRGDEVLLSVDAPNDTRIRLEEVGPRAVRVAVTTRRGTARPTSAEYQVAVGPRGAELVGGSGQAVVDTDCAKGSALYRSFADARRWMHDTFDASSERPFIKFGGQRSCVADGVMTIPIPDIPFDVIRLNFLPKRGLVLAPGWSRAAVLKRGRDEILFSELEHQLCILRPCNRPRVVGFVAGKTHYSIERGKSGMDLRITPTAYGHRKVCRDQRDADCKQVPDGRFHSAWQTPGPASKLWLEPFTGDNLLWIAMLTLLAVAIGGPSLVVLVSRLSRTDPDAVHEPRSRVWGQCLVAVAAIVAGLTSLRGISWFQADASVPATPFPVLVSWGAAMLTVFAAFGSGLHLRLFMIVLTGMVALGHYGLAAIAFASNDLRFARFYNEATSGLGLFAAALALAAVLPTGFYARLAERCVQGPAGNPSRGVPHGLWILLGLSALNLFLWLAFGTDTGIANLYQPSEVAKTIAVVVLAALVAIVLRPQLGAGRRRSVRAMLTAFVGIMAILAVFLVVPVVKNDNSPFLILALTAMLSFLVILVLHQSAVWSEARLVSDRLSELPTHMRVKSMTVQESMRRWSGGVRRLLWTRGVCSHPFEVLGCTLATLVLGLTLGLFIYAKNNPDRVKEVLDPYVGGSFTVPATRVLSWLELLPRPGSNQPIIALPDTGQQVMRSRTVMLAAACQLNRRAWRNALPEWMQQLTPALAANVVDQVDQAIERGCAIGGSGRSEQVQAAALMIPEVHSDFIGSWLMVVLGRDGVLMLMLLQILFVLLGLLAALSLARWVQTARISHAAATLIAYTIVGLTIVLTLQWALSWGNTFGVTPVVGQPATFLSAGRSHLLSFGLAMVTAMMVGLRLTKTRGWLRLDPVPPVPGKYARSLIVRWQERAL